MPYLIHLPLLFILSWFCWHKTAKSPLRRFFWPALLLKLIAGIGLGLLYLYYYPYRGDTFAYFNDAVRLNQLAYQHPLSYLQSLYDRTSVPAQVASQLTTYSQQRAFFFTRILSPICLFAGSNYWISSLYLSWFSFWGMWQLAQTLSWLFPAYSGAIAVAWLFFPSIVWWSSGILKESFTMGIMYMGIHYLLSAYFGVHSNKKPVRILLIAGFIIISIVVVWWLKFYYLFWAPCFLAFVLADQLSRRLSWTAPISLIAVATVTILLLTLTPLLKPGLTLELTLQSIVANYEGTIRNSLPANAIKLNDLKPTADRFALNLPMVLFSGLYRPLPWEGNHLLQYWVGFENFFLLLLTLPAGLSIWWVRGSSVRLLLIVTAAYILTMALLLAFTSPNFGTLSRYKVGYQPMLVNLLLAGTVLFVRRVFLSKANPESQ